MAETTNLKAELIKVRVSQKSLDDVATIIKHLRQAVEPARKLDLLSERWPDTSEAVRYALSFTASHFKDHR